MKTTYCKIEAIKLIIRVVDMHKSMDESLQLVSGHSLYIIVPVCAFHVRSQLIQHALFQQEVSWVLERERAVRCRGLGKGLDNESLFLMDFRTQ